MDTKLKKYLSREQPRARQQEKTQEDDEQPEVKRDPWGIGRSLSDTDLED